MIDAILNSEGQESKVLQFFIDNPNNSYAPHEVQRSVLPRCPITSARRAMTNLTKANVLFKTDEKVLGSYGKYVYTWELRHIFRPEGSN